jgi:hypothetical protein
LKWRRIDIDRLRGRRAEMEARRKRFRALFKTNRVGDFPVDLD